MLKVGNSLTSWPLVLIAWSIFCSLAFAQEFRSPNIDVNQARSNVQENLNQRNGRNGFVPDKRENSFGVVPVRPRKPELSGEYFEARPDSNAMRSQVDEQILKQLRSGEFDNGNVDLTQKPGPQIVRQRYENGKDQLVRQVIQDDKGNFLNHGPWRLYNRRGELMASGQFSNGMMDGTWERWHGADSAGIFKTQPFTEFEGPFFSTATFSEGKLDGVWVITDRYRRKIIEVPYVRGQRNGTAIWWYPSSDRMRVINFKDGKLDGPLLEWNEKKQLVRNDEFIDGQQVIRQRTMFRPNQKNSESFFLDSKLMLEAEDSWWDAEPAEYIQVGRKVQHGPTFAWFENGQQKMAGQYRENVRVGKFMWWHDNGQRSLSGRYNDEGQKMGVWTWWHRNGMKAIEGEYVDDQPSGQWKWWAEDGQLEDSREYGDLEESNGVLVTPDSSEAVEQEATEESDDDLEPPTEGMEELEEIRPGDDQMLDDALFEETT